MSFTQATRLALNLDDSQHSRQPSPYWTYNSRRLNELYEDVYGADEEDEDEEDESC